MKKVFGLLIFVAFMVAAPLAMAKENKVNCCVKGKCSKMTDAKCDKAKGEVVKNCKDCNPYGRGRPKDYDKNPPSKGTKGSFDTRTKEGERYYHGMSQTDLNREIKQDKRRGKLPEGGKTTWYEAHPNATAEQIREHERQKIMEHQPPGNLRGGGGGRPASE